MPSITYERVLACGHCGHRVSVTQKHEWTQEELSATFYLPCKCFAEGPGATSALKPHRVQFVQGEKMRELVIARDAVNLAAVSIQCDRGHLSRDVSLQQAELRYEGACDECGGLVPLSAHLKRKP